jgi:hypothetical protein
LSREPLAQEEHFDPSKVSASRANKLAECGVAFRMHYIDQIPAPRRGSFALFGTVVHAALEKWALDRSTDLVSLMKQAWIAETEGTAVKEFLAEYQNLSGAVLRAEKAAAEAYEANPRNKGKKSQAPRMTKHFKESDAAKAMYRLLSQWNERLVEESPWDFSERDPLPSFYDDSLIIAKRYARQWGHLPKALHTEFSFTISWRGFTLTGYVDEIEVLVSPEGELLGLGIVDYKTYRTEPAEQKDYRQLVMYDVAVRQLVAEGAIALPFDLAETKLFVGIDYVRQAGVECDWSVLVPEGSETSGGNSRAWWEMTEADRDWLERDLKDYAGIVAGGHFRPADKGQKADFCDYGELCCLRSAETLGGSARRVGVRL